MVKENTSPNSMGSVGRNAKLLLVWKIRFLSRAFSPIMNAMLKKIDVESFSSRLVEGNAAPVNEYPGTNA